MTFKKTGLERINQPLAHVRTRDEAIDQDVNVVEVGVRVIVRRAQLDHFAATIEARESTLHEAHHVRGNRVS